MAGFGIREYATQSPDWIKMTATNVVSAVNTFELHIQGRAMITSPGDSGGPAFLEIEGREVVAGITSWGTGFFDNINETSAFTRVDRYLDEIDAFVAEHDPQTPSCGADGVCGYPCTTVDPDCPCGRDTQCAAACPNPDRDLDCPVGCAAGGTCVRTGCPVPDPDCGEKPMGATCSSGSECASELCAMATGGTVKVCSERCGSGGSCASGFTCDGNNVCLPDAADDEGGGGCAVAGGRSPGGGAAALLLLAALLTRRVSASWPRPRRPRRPRRW